MTRVTDDCKYPYRLVYVVDEWFRSPQPVPARATTYNPERIMDAVDRHLGVISRIIGVITAAGLIGISVIGTQLDNELWSCLPSELKLEFVINPFVVVLTLIFVGVAGLLYVLIFVSVPTTWTSFRSLVAITIVLIAVILTIGFWGIVYQLTLLVDLGLSGQCSEVS